MSFDQISKIIEIHGVSGVTNEEFICYNHIYMVLITEEISDPPNTLGLPLYNKCVQKLDKFKKPIESRTETFIKSGSIFVDTVHFKIASVYLECWNLKVPEHISTVIPDRNTPNFYDWNWYFEKGFGIEKFMIVQNYKVKNGKFKETTSLPIEYSILQKCISSNSEESLNKKRKGVDIQNKNE